MMGIGGSKHKRLCAKGDSGSSEYVYVYDGPSSHDSTG
jgi:hypothetical protein